MRLFDLPTLTKRIPGLVEAKSVVLYTHYRANGINCFPTKKKNGIAFISRGALGQLCCSSCKEKAVQGLSHLT